MGGHAGQASRLAASLRFPELPQPPPPPPPARPRIALRRGRRVAPRSAGRPRCAAAIGSRERRGAQLQPAAPAPRPSRAASRPRPRSLRSESGEGAGEERPPPRHPRRVSPAALPERERLPAAPEAALLPPSLPEVRVAASAGGRGARGARSGTAGEKRQSGAVLRGEALLTASFQSEGAAVVPSFCAESQRLALPATLPWEEAALAPARLDGAAWRTL